MQILKSHKKERKLKKERKKKRKKENVAIYKYRCLSQVSKNDTR